MIRRWNKIQLARIRALIILRVCEVDGRLLSCSFDGGGHG